MAAPAIRPALLSAAGVAAIVRAALGAGKPDATCQALREASGGNPFYLGELLRAQATAETGGARLPAGAAVARWYDPTTGAYGYSMASNYNKVPRPAVVFVRDGQARVVVRRETPDDLLRLDQA